MKSEQKYIELHDKQFELFISNDRLKKAAKRMAKHISRDFENRDKFRRPIFVGILDGSFRFMADLLNEINIECGVSFLKLKSYEQLNSTGKVNELIGLKEDIRDRHIIIVEDIVDTGLTIEYVKEELLKYDPKKIKIATLLFKPDSYKKDIDIDYYGFGISNDFVVGYGLDYDGLGRNLNSIYKICEK